MKNILKDLLVKEISFVDKPAQAGARVVLIKNKGGDNGEVNKGMFLEALDMEGVIQPVRDILDAMYSHNHYLGKAIEDAVRYSDIKDKSKTIQQIVKEWSEAVQVLFDQVVNHVSIAKRGKTMTPDEVKNKVAEMFKNLLEGKDIKHDDQDRDAKIAKMVEDATDKLTAELSNKLTKTEEDAVVNKMKPEYQEYLQGIAGDSEVTDEVKLQKRQFFLSKEVTDEHRDMLVKAAGIEVKKEQDTTYTDNTGQVFKRSELGAAFDSTVTLAKRNEKLTERLNKVQQDKDDTDMLVKNRQDFPNLPGDSAARLALAKSIASIEDEGVREQVTTILKAGNAALGDLMATAGHSTPATSGAAGEVEKLAAGIHKSHQEAGTPITRERAYAMALESEAGDAAYNQAQSEKDQPAAH